MKKLIWLAALMAALPLMAQTLQKGSSEKNPPDATANFVDYTTSKPAGSVLANCTGAPAAPAFTLFTPAADCGVMVLQATTPGTQQGSAASKNFNINGSGILQLDNITSVYTPALILQNTTGALVGAQQQNSPGISFLGSGWNTGGGAAHSSEWRIFAINAGGNPSSATLTFAYSDNGGAFTNLFQMLGNTSGALSLGSSATIRFSSNARISSAGGGILTITDSGGTTGLPNVPAAPTVSSNATIAPTNWVTIISGTAAISTITVPANFTGGCINLIPTGAFTTGTGGNIRIASTAVVGKTMIMCWDGTKWDPSY